MNIDKYIRMWARLINESTTENDGYDMTNLIQDEKTYGKIMKKLKDSLAMCFHIKNDSGEVVSEVKSWDYREQDFKKFDGMELVLFLDMRSVFLSMNEANRPGPVRDRRFSLEVWSKFRLREFKEESGLDVETQDNENNVSVLRFKPYDIDRFRLWVYK